MVHTAHSYDERFIPLH